MLIFGQFWWIVLLQYVKNKIENHTYINSSVRKMLLGLRQRGNVHKYKFQKELSTCNKSFQFFVFTAKSWLEFLKYFSIANLSCISIKKSDIMYNKYFAQNQKCESTFIITFTIVKLLLQPL